MTDIERIIIRMNETGLAMSVTGDRLVIEGDTRGLSPEDRDALARLKSDIIAYLSAAREHVAILCKHRQPDGRACGDIVTYQRPTGKVAWCQVCYGEETDSRRAVNRHANPSAESIVPNPPHVVLPLRRPKAKKQAEAQAMYVASDLSHWITNEPHIWADKMTIHGKEFIRLTPMAVAWFKDKIAKAEDACNKGKIPLDAFTRIVQAFCPVYEFAVATGMVPDPGPPESRSPRRTA